jgi:hypothetical protein
MGCTLSGPWGNKSFGTIEDGTMHRGWSFPPKPTCATATAPRHEGNINWHALQLYPSNNGPFLQKILDNAVYAQFAARAYDGGNLKGSSPWPQSFEPFGTLLNRLFPDKWEIEYDNWTLGYNDNDGMRVLVFRNETKKVVAFRGSIGHKLGLPAGSVLRQSRDWITDNNLRNEINIEFLPELTAARELVGSFRSRDDTSFTGHSLGGSMAQYAAVALAGKKAVSFDAVPIRESLSKSSIKNPDASGIMNFYGENDPAHTLGKGIGKDIPVNVPGSISRLQSQQFKIFPTYQLHMERLI